VNLSPLGFYLAHHSGVMQMTTTRPHQLGSQSSPKYQMSNPPAQSESDSYDLELLQLVRAIKTSKAHMAALEMQGLQKETLNQNRLLRKQINRFLEEVLPHLKPLKLSLIKQWPKFFDIESIVAEAANNALIEVVKNIDKFDPDLPNANVVKWINKIFNFRFLDLLKKYRKHHKLVSIDDDPDGMLEGEIARISEPEAESRGSQVLRFVETDPDGHLSKDHIKGKPTATFKAILLMRDDNLTWQNIADHFDIPTHSTVSGFVTRRSKYWKKYFNKYLSP
jgi:DNA-directed RNA polymerase specialized sigma24 family protein